MFGECRPRTVISLSAPKTNRAPNKKPKATGTKAYSPLAPYNFDSTACSMAGDNRDQKDAAVITPAANPKLVSNNFL